MIKEKQIKEFADAIYDIPNAYDTYWRSHCEQLAEDLYEAGYRKQHETIDEFANLLKEHLDDTYTKSEDVLTDGHNLIDYIVKKMKGGTE